MCGICGVIDPNPEAQLDREMLDRMSHSLLHRGPDHSGSFVDRGAGLAIRRLSIIDLATGQQPIQNEDGSLTIVFNGEIYNYRELRRTLQSLGHQFKTHSDTEVILHAYEEFGEDAFTYLNGMFAFAIWDARQRLLIAARDRVGIKPLHYALRGGLLLFGSELRSILASGKIDPKLDTIALNQYLSFEYVPAPRTIFKGVCKLPAGYVLRYSAKGLELKQYWRPQFARSESRAPVSWKEYERRLREELHTAVKREMVSDVPIGVLLSGGIDSSSVAAMMVRESPGQVQSFSIGFSEPSFDESSYAKLASKNLDTKHHELLVTPQMICGVVDKLPELLDEPLADSSFVPTFLLSRFAREQVKVALGGDGGDEIFAGYPTLQAHRAVEYYERLLPLSMRARIIPALIELLPSSFSDISLDFKARRFLAGRGFSLEVRHHRWLGAFTDEEKAELYRAEALLDGLDTYAIARQHMQQCDAHDALNQLLYLDQKLYLEGDILVKVDRASMANSLEVRVPLLNSRFLDFVNELPGSLKLHYFTTKYLLRKSMRSVLPPQIIRRNKKGFNMPVAKLIQTDLKERVRDILSAERLARSATFDSGFVQKLLEEHLAGRRDHRKLLWTLFVFEAWREKQAL